MNLNVRDVPGPVHAELLRRADRAGLSLRAYVVQVLAEHTATPTVEDWLDTLPVAGVVGERMSTVDALRQAREEDDAAVAGG